jgi:hypothetical protein
MHQHRQRLGARAQPQMGRPPDHGRQFARYGQRVPAAAVRRAWSPGQERIGSTPGARPTRWPIGCPLVDDWPDGPTDLAVVNVHDRTHDIVKYPARPEAVRSIDDRLTA